MKTTLIYRSTSRAQLNLFCNLITSMAHTLRFKISIIRSCIKKKRRTLLKSPHVNKRSKENFELKIYKFKLYSNLNFFEIKILRSNTPKNIHTKAIYYK